MKFTFNFTSLRDLFASLRTPIAEIRPPLAHTNLRVQKRGTDLSPEYHLRFSTFGNVSYYRLQEAELGVLARALEKIREPQTR